MANPTQIKILIPKSIEHMTQDKIKNKNKGAICELSTLRIIFNYHDLYFLF